MTFHFRQFVSAPAESVAKFYASVENLLRISPPFPRLHIHASDPRVVAGKVFPMSLDLAVARVRWESVIESVEPGGSFADVMHGKLIRYWCHVHRYEAHEGKTLLTDQIECDVPWWLSGCVWFGVHALFLYRRLALPGALR